MDRIERRAGTPNQKLALAIRHVHFEDCGLLGDVLIERGFGIRYIDIGQHELQAADVDAADLVIGLGGPVSVYDEAQYPWIRDELALFESALVLGKPLIGLCLGAQMIAHALGARVYPGPVKELGWQPLELTPEGRDSVVAPLGEAGVSMLHWHGDTFDLPRDAVRLASTADVPNQIFERGRNVLALQCHPEIRPNDIERWLIGHACEIAGTKGVSVPQLRADTARLAPALNSRARRVFGDWLDRLP